MPVQALVPVRALPVVSASARRGAAISPVSAMLLAARLPMRSADWSAQPTLRVRARRELPEPPL
jgi:hypothetical protein